jgi:hypothetical protein
MEQRHAEGLDLGWICRSALQARYEHFRGAEISASFYPYVGLTHTIRKRDGVWVIRISDLCRNAPRIVLEAIAIMLGAKILRRKPPREMIRVYHHFRREQVVEKLVNEQVERKGRKVLVPHGRFHPLHEISDEVNRQFFGGRVELNRIGWSVRRSWGRLGHYDPVHNTVTISPVLDSPRVPRPVVAFIVYHEMLHTLYNDRTPKGTWRHHPPEFRRAEKSHPHYEAATRFLRSFCRTRGRKQDSPQNP